MRIPAKGVVSAPIVILIVVVATVGVAGTVTYLYDSSHSPSAPYSKYCSANKSIDVNITSFEVQFVYTGSSKDYLSLISQGPNTHVQSSAATCPLYFVDAVIVNGVDGSQHVFSNLSLSPNSFVFAYNGGFSGPQTAAQIFPTFTIAYVGATSYAGPLVINIYSSS